jgi:hypothetical protein
MVKKGTTMTLETPDGTYSIMVGYHGMAVGELVNEIVIPLLLAAGYQRESINDALGIEEEVEP